MRDRETEAVGVNRRRFLAGSALVGGGSVAAFALDVPDSLELALAKRRSIPAIDPSVVVPESAVASARTHVETLLEDARREWEQADTSGLDRHERRWLAEALDTADGTVRELEDAPTTLESLEKAQYAAGRVAKTLGAARYLNDRFDAEAVRADADGLRRDAETFREGIEYACSDPSDFLVHVGQVEYNAQQAASYADRAPNHLPSESENDQREGERDGRAVAAGEARSTVESARRDLQDGRRILRAYRSRAGDGEPFADALARNRSEVVTSAGELRERGGSDALDGLPDGPYSRVRDRLFSHGWMLGRSTLSDAERLRDEGYEAYAAVLAAEALQHFRAWEYGRERHEIGRDDETIDRDLVAQARREAVRTFQDALDAGAENPLVRRLLEIPRTQISSGDRSLGRESENHPRSWAYGRYLLAAGHATHAVETAEQLARW